MRVLVTGGTGFVGAAVVLALLSDGHQAVALVRDPARARAIFDAGAELRIGDMLSPDTYTPAVGGVDAVVHTAMLSVPGRLTAARARRLFAADAAMTAHLADACLLHGRRLVYTGGCFDWGDHGEDWIDEDTPLSPSPMGVGHARQAVYLNTRLKDGLDVVRLSRGFVYGPGGLFTSAFVDQARSGRLRCLGRGHNWWSCIHVDDLAQAYLAALTKADPGRSYAVVDDQPIRLRQLTDTITDALGLRRVGAAPPLLMSLFLGHTLTASLTTSFRIDGARIRTDLGWTPHHRTFHDGVHDAIPAPH